MHGRFCTWTAVAAFAVLGAGGCGGGNSLESTHSGDGPRLVSSTPPAGGALAANRRSVRLRFDDVIDTGAQVSIEFNGSDVIAGEPELTNDRRGLDAVIDAEDRGRYSVAWRACSAERKTECSKGTFGFSAPGSS